MRLVDETCNARWGNARHIAALEGQGYAHEGKGELDQALAAYERLERENKSDFLAGMGLYHKGRILTLISNRTTVEESVASADLVIGAVLVPGALAPHLVSKSMVASMKPGSVVVDISID